MTGSESKMNSSIEAIDASCDVPEDGAAPLTSGVDRICWSVTTLGFGEPEEGRLSGITFF